MGYLLFIAEDFFESENNQDILDEAFVDIATTRVKYFRTCKNLVEKIADLEDKLMTNQISQLSEQSQENVEVIEVPEVMLPNLSRLHTTNTRKFNDLSPRVGELRKVMEIVDRRRHIYVEAFSEVS
uniref:Uncharacterized protein n=1 Tax=Rhodnius prolixus TaxID=13249 RepID=T1ID55_RHOPR